jgi:uncharacterized protein with HEPN domain
MKNDQVYIQHILESIDRIQDYTEDITEEEFREKDMVQDAVVRQIEIIGEATKQLSEQEKEKYPDVPWKDIAGMRDNLIHNYFGVDLQQVWQTIQKDIPSLKDKLEN